MGYEQPTRDEWEADLVAYDQLLLQAATMLDVALPGAPSGPEGPVVADALTARQRDRLEVGLVDAGLDIRSDDL